MAWLYFIISWAAIFKSEWISGEAVAIIIPQTVCEQRERWNMKALEKWDCDWVTLPALNACAFSRHVKLAGGGGARRHDVIQVIMYVSSRAVKKIQRESDSMAMSLLAF